MNHVIITVRNENFKERAAGVMITREDCLQKGIQISCEKYPTTSLEQKQITSDQKIENYVLFALIF